MSGVQRAGAWWRSYWVCALPFLVTLPRFRNGFAFDDVFVMRSDFIFDIANLPRALVNRTMIASSLDKVVGRPGMDTYRPLSIASFFWDAAVSGHSPWSYHLTNALLHTAVCALLLALLNQLLPELSQRYRSGLTAWFGLAPWLAEAHVFINGRSDPLLAIGFLLALLFMRRALVEQRFALGLAAGGSLLASLLCKEIAVLMLPFVAAVPTPGGPRVRERLRYGWPLLAALGLYLVLRAFALSGLRTHSDGSQLWLALAQLPLVLLDGSRHVLLPSPYFLRNMRDDYAVLAPWVVPAAWLLTLALGTLLLRQLRRRYTLVWSLAFALAALAPAALISTSLWPGFGRYLYVPALGFSIALGCALHFWLDSGARAARLAFPALLGCSALAGLLLLDATLGFSDERTLYARAIAERPRQAWPLGFLGLALRNEQRCPEAIPYLSRAASLDPDESRYAIRLGQCLLETGSVEAARQVAEAGRARFRGTRSEPGFLLVAARALPSTQSADQRALLQRCLAVDPERSDCRMLLRLLEARSSGAPSLPAAEPAHEHDAGD
jgi:protein O-mannosyl-transferase